MKAFFINLLATVTGLFVFCILGFFVLIGIIGAVASSGDQVPVVKENSVLHIPLGGMLVEQVIENPFEEILGDAVSQLGIREAINAIEKAKSDINIKGIYLESKYMQGSYAQFEEIRDALISFKESGKFIYAYGDYMSESDYYLASIADSIFLNPEGSLEFNGMAANIMFYKGMFDKLEIEPVVFRVGQYKSFVEPYIRKDMSEENREQYTELLNSIYDYYLQNVAEARGLDVAELEKVSDGMLVNYAEDAEKFGLITKVAYEDEVKDVMKSRLGLEGNKEVTFVSISNYIKTATTASTGKNRIAVIVANGEIVPSAGDDEGIGGEQFAKHIRKAREDKNVKAIVLRINSPGGSLLGSDLIWREVMLTRGVKPIIASMGGVAASGGYYIAMAADTIVAQPNTITGSIGIFSILFNVENFLDNKLGLTHDVVGTGNHSDFITVTREYTPYEKEFMQNGVNEGYRTFTTKVAEGRGMAIEDVLAVASGRVWTGLQAKENGLVDVLGDYEDAIKLAADAAGLEEYSLKMYPVQKPFFEKLMSEFGGQARSIFAKDHILAAYEKQLKSLQRLEGIQARMPGELIIE
jgi:protease-4